ncbi:MAG TPA: hypothetical protein VGX27_02380 [Candidatus Dormibacteraeota bacterium]|nr:hypothetical protein [Candidatus Dormibacteraeota bacterium]
MQPTRPEAYPTSEAAAAGRAYVEAVMELRDPTRLSRRLPAFMRTVLPDELQAGRDPADVGGLTLAERDQERFRIQLAIALYDGQPPPWLISRLRHLGTRSSTAYGRPHPRPAIPWEDLDK